MNFSSSCLTARQMLPPSPSQKTLITSASFASSRAGHGTLQARGPFVNKAEQPQYHKQLTIGASTSRVYSARPGQLNQSNLPGPPSESAHRRVKHSCHQTQGQMVKATEVSYCQQSQSPYTRADQAMRRSNEGLYFGSLRNSMTLSSNPQSTSESKNLPMQPHPPTQADMLTIGYACDELEQAVPAYPRWEDTTGDQNGAGTNLLTPIVSQPNSGARTRSPPSCPSEDDPFKDQHKKENMGDMKVKL